MLPCCHVASVDCAVVALFRCRRSFFAARFMVIAYVKNGGFVVIFFNFYIKICDILILIRVIAMT